MNPDTFKGVSRENYPGLDEETERAFKSINPILTKMISILQGRVNTDNLNEEIKTIEVFHNQPVKVTLNKIKGPPQGVVPIYNSLYDYAQVAWKQLEEGKVEVKCSFSSTPTAKVQITLQFKGI